MSRVGWTVGMLAACTVAGYLAAFRQSAAIALIAIGVLAIMVVVFAPLRFKIERPWSAPPAPELLLLPLLVEGQVFIGFRVTAALCVALIFYLTTVKPSRTTPRALMLAGVVVSFALPLSRPNSSESQIYAWGPVLLLLVILVMSVRRRTPHAFMSSLIDGIGLYLIVNVVAYFAGVVSPGAADRVGGLEASGGGLRVIFPIATALAVPAAMAAIYVAAGAICFERSGLVRRTFRAVSLVAAAYILVKADTRAAIVVAFVIFLASIISTRALARLTVPITAVSVVFAFIFSSIQDLVGAVVSGVVAFAPGLSRGSGSDLELNFRSTLWARTLTYWHEYVDWPGRLIGFGERGQEQSGASSTYAFDFAGLSSDPRSISVHNSYLQQLYDGGFVGLVALVGLLLWASHRYASDLRASVPGAQFAVPALLAAVTTGITEVILAPGYQAAPAYIMAGLILYAGTKATPADEAPEAPEPEDVGLPALRPVGRRR